MNLEQLPNNELIDRFDKLDCDNYVFKDRSQKVLDAYLELLLLPGVQDANNSRQTIIDFIREEEELQPPKNKRRMGEGRRRKSRRGKKSRRGRKSRRSRRGRK
jgi:hypothetical protein